MLALPRLLLVTDRLRCPSDWEERVEAAVRAGVHFVLLRERDLPDEVVRRVAVRLLRAGPPELRLSISDRPGLALELGVGLHLPSASPWPPSRPQLLGRSLHPSDAPAPLPMGLDYALWGTLFPTSSKPGHPGVGLASLRAAAQQLPCPVYGIGGVTAGRVGEVLGAGAWGVAVSTAILAAVDPGAAAREMLAHLPAITP